MRAVCVCVCVCVCVHILAYLVSKAAAEFEDTRLSSLEHLDEQSGSSAHNHSTTLVPGRAAVALAPGSATPELDSTHMKRTHR